MQYNNTEIKDLNDLVLIQAVQQMNDALKKRDEAGKHPKFDKNNKKKYIGDFPPPNPAFIELKTALELEMSNRKLKLEN